MPYTIKALGSNGSGQLGIGHLEDVSHPVECLFFDSVPTSSPIKVAAGGNHTLLLFADGSVYATGNNIDGRCGVPSQNTTLTKFHRVQYQDELGHTVQTFKFIAATWEASIFITPDFKIFTSGSGNFGELGQGENVIRSPTPRQVSAFPLQNSEIVDIAACMRHCAVVLSGGQVYGWGAARKGQLGEPRLKAVSVPRQLALPEIDQSSANSFLASRVLCCRDLTCIVEASGPSSHFAILGLDTTGILNDNAIHSIVNWKGIAASWSGVFLLDADHAIKGWGKNWIPSGPSSTVYPKRIAAGSEHVLAETEDGIILATGWGEHGNCGEPVGEGGRVEDRWNEIGVGAILGAGCATSWIFSV